MNRWLILYLSFIFIGCSSQQNFVSIDSGNHAEIEILEKDFSRVFGSGKLVGKGQSNFSSNFVFESKDDFSYIVFKDIIGRRLFLVEVDKNNTRYVNMRKNEEIEIEDFNKFFPVATKFDASTYKRLLWGTPDVFEDLQVKTKNTFLISTKLISRDGVNFLNELTFSLNNEKQKYTILFNQRNFEI